MVTLQRLCLLSLLLIGFTATLPAQMDSAAPPSRKTGKIYLDVVVTPKNGKPVAGLQQQDFTLLDNKVAQSLTSFQAFGPQAPVEVILVIDAVNATYQTVAFERQQIEKFLQANGNHLAHPTALAVLTDTGTQMQNSFSTDGKQLSDALDHYTVGLRTIRRSTGIYGADERLQLSLKALQELSAREGPRPGRKLILWVSPGWPILSGPGIQLDNKQQQGIYATIVSVSTMLREGRITLYNIDPLGASQSVSRAFYYESFMKGVSKPSQTDIGDLSLQVLSTQSGGLVLTSSNDVAALLQRAIDDAEAYYEVSFNPSPSEHGDEYHRLDVQVAGPGLTARTRQSYYANPSSQSGER
jgi:VWFA-related protein